MPECESCEHPEETVGPLKAWANFTLICEECITDHQTGAL